MILENQNNNVEQQINSRDGPTNFRSCTDFACCVIYLLLIAAVIFFAFFAGNGAKLTPVQIQQQLRDLDGSDPLLSITASLQYILFSMAVALAISLLLTIISFLIPALVVYIIVPLLLLVMLILGAAFLYRYFGQALPFISNVTQQSIAASHSTMSLIIGIAFIIGFIAALIVIVVKKNRLSYVVVCLKIAKFCFWQNTYLILISICLSVVSVAALFVNIRCLQVAALQRDNKDILNKWIFGAIVLVQMLWTHGYLQAYSDFLFESIAIHWYFGGKKYGRSYSCCSNCLCESISLSFRHIGTISFGWILAYIPESLNIFFHRCQQTCESFYSACCCIHKCLCENLSKYCYIGTIMYSQPFCPASKEVREIRMLAKQAYPQLYMVGNFYITLVKIFIIFFSVIGCYFFMAEKGDRYVNILNMLTPLIVTLLGSTEIATHFLNATGLIGDTIYLTYTLDQRCERDNFGNLDAQHCPQGINVMIKEAMQGRYQFSD